MKPAAIKDTLPLLLLSLLMLVPLGVVLSSFLNWQPEIWAHLGRYVLPGVLFNTGLMLLGVALGTLLIGTGLAWLTSACDFPGRRFFAWALVLPLAMPAYVLAFVLVGLLDFSGPLQSQLREWGVLAGGLPPIRWRSTTRS